MSKIRVEDRGGNVGVSIDGHEFQLDRSAAEELSGKLVDHLYLADRDRPAQEKGADGLPH